MSAALHTLVVIVIQIAVGLATGNWWVGGLACLYWAGREVAQAEYRWIEHHGSGLRANLRWDSIYRTPGIWTTDALWADLLVPAAAAVALAVVGPQFGAGVLDIVQQARQMLAVLVG